MSSNRFAYVTLLYGDNTYFLGTLVFIISLLKTKPKYDTVLLYTNDVPLEKINILKEYYTKLIKIDYILFENKIKRKRFVDIYTKLQIFKLTDYEKILFMDNDMYVQKNIDNLFNYSTPAGMAISENLKYKDNELVIDRNIVFNAGVWLLKPSLEEFNKLMEGLRSFNVSYQLEQEYVSYFYSGKWTNISYLYNFQFTLSSLEKTPIRAKVYKNVNIEDISVIHYSSSTKPWDTISDSNKTKKNKRFNEYTEYYGIWIKEFLKIYQIYIDKGIDILKLNNILKNYNVKKIDKILNDELQNIFGTKYDNYEIIDRNINKLYNTMKYANSYKFYIIPGLSDKIKKILGGKLININSTYDNMFDELFTISNNIYIVGGTIRDSFLNKKPKDIDLAFNSNYKSVVDLCKKNEWPCPEIYEKGFPYVVFGVQKGQTLEAAYKSSSIFDKGNAMRDYTVNNMVYDVKNNILIDLTKMGLVDILNKKIRIPVPPDRYNDWATNRWKHPLRYFKLINIGLTPYDKNTELFIINYIENNFETVYMKITKGFPTIQYYLIVSITGGEVYDNGKYEFGYNKKQLIPHLKIMSQYLNKKIMLKIINLFL